MAVNIFLSTVLTKTELLISLSNNVYLIRICVINYFNYTYGFSFYSLIFITKQSFDNND